MTEERSLQVKSGNTTINLTFSNEILSIAGARRTDIPSRNILDVALKPSPAGTTHVDIQALVPFKVNKLKLNNFNYEVVQSQSADSWVEFVKNVAYQKVKPNKHLKIFINPNSGTGKAVKIFEKEVKPIFDAAGCKCDIVVTNGRDDAKRKIIEASDLQNYDAIVVVSGDGIVHEVVNGLLSRKDESFIKIPIGVIPAGSGNALNVCLHGETINSSMQHSALTIIKGVPMDVDICSITQEDGEYFSFLSQTYGATADCDLRTENLRWIGDSRFTLGVLMAILEGRRYEWEMAIKYSEKNKDIIKQNYKKAYAEQKPKDVSDSEGIVKIERKYGSVNDPIPKDWEILSDDIFAFYSGKLPWVGKGAIPFPCALPNDGLMDVIIVNRDKISRLRAISMMQKIAKGTHIDLEEVDYYKVEAFRLTPKSRDVGYISIDGEK
ncbi:15529_t:CDS:2 [Acaulospora colombiana]|uniref:15529_t:CDS:1 n=1 Tax=Acaulospora colombiana TaxID=27376 RepID=A0ACA9KVB2_9GLOM|nr:15529_t:CDS:2 [Acaulospora colombiana]